MSSSEIFVALLTRQMRRAWDAGEDGQWVRKWVQWSKKEDQDQRVNCDFTFWLCGGFTAGFEAIRGVSVRVR